jgi:hypothetical protein
MTSNRWRIFRQTAIIAIGVLIIKYVFHILDWEILTVTSLHSSVLAGTIFVLGFILSSTHADYKESEKMPVELSTALENLYQDGMLFKEKNKEFDLDSLRENITEVLRQFKKDVQDHTSESFQKAKELALHIAKMEAMGAPANYVVKMKQDQATVVRTTLRMRYLLRIQPLPSAFILVEFIVFGVITMLMLTDIPKLADEMAITAFFSFLYYYILKLIEVMDLPFHAEGTTQDDVSLFLLEEQIERLAKK